jgi:hypothetical protein
MDTDCEVRASLNSIFDAVPQGSIGVVRDGGAAINLSAGARMYNSGTLLVDHSDPIIAEWAACVLSDRAKWPGDQDVLSELIHNTARDRIVELSTLMVSVHGRANLGQVVRHWCGRDGKNEIRRQIAGGLTGGPSPSNVPDKEN